MPSLCEKYAPITLASIVGNRSAIAKLEEFGAAVSSGGRPTPLIIFGHSGTGKSAAARAIAYMNDFEIIELNASDYRDADNLGKKLLPAGTSKGLFNKHSLIIFDEIDELSIKFDAGAEAIITQMIRVSKQPIIFIANDYWSRKIVFLREKLDQVEFKRVSKDEVLAYLKTILAKEGKMMDADVLETIANRNNGDVRGALNDLELMIDAPRELLENLGIRDRKGEVFSILDKIFTSANFDIARNAANTNDISIDMLFSWVNENVPNRYLSKGSISEAYDNLARASMFLENAERSKYYGYLRYSSVLLSSGVAIANRGNISLRPYVFPSNIKYLSKTKKGRDAINNIAKGLMPVLHMHKRDIINDFLPLLKRMIDVSNVEVGEEKTLSLLGSKYGLEKEDAKAIAEYCKYR